MNSDNFNIPKQPTKEPHSGTAGIEFPVVQGVEAISEDVVANTEIPSTVTAGFGEEGSVAPSEKVTWDQSKAAVRDLYAQPETPKKSKKGLFIAIGAGAASLLVLGGTLLGVNSAKDGNKTETLPPEPTPNASAPVTPGAQESTAPTPSSEPTPEQPTQSPETGASTGKAAEFNMTDAEYQQVVDSFKIDLASHSTPESAVAAFNEKMTSYFNGGHTKEEHTKYYAWSAPDKNPGWNSWADEVYTSAIKDGMFTKNYSDVEDNYLQKMIDLKTEANRMWANTDRANQPSYKMAFNFVPTGDINSFETGWINATGNLTYTDNAADSSETATDSHAIGSYTFSNVKITMQPDKDTGTWRVTQISTAN